MTKGYMYEEFEKDHRREVGETVSDRRMKMEHLVGRPRPVYPYFMLKDAFPKGTQIHFPESDDEDRVMWKPQSRQGASMMRQHIIGRPRPSYKRFFFNDSECVESDSEDYISESYRDPFIAERIQLEDARKQRVVAVTVGSILALALLL